MPSPIKHRQGEGYTSLSALTHATQTLTFPAADAKKEEYCIVAVIKHQACTAKAKVTRSLSTVAFLCHTHSRFPSNWQK